MKDLIKSQALAKMYFSSDHVVKRLEASLKGRRRIVGVTSF